MTTDCSEVIIPTPGPWEAKKETEYVPAQVWADGRQIAEVYGEDRYTRRCNAALMAAAPELLAALKRAVQLLKACGANVDDDEPILRVIAKAEWLAS
jgi:hypothetical protein